MKEGGVETTRLDGVNADPVMYTAPPYPLGAAQLEKEEWVSVSVAESRVAERTAPFPDERLKKEAEMLSVREAVEEREMRGEEREREEVVDAGVSVMEVSVRCPDVAEKRLVVKSDVSVKENWILLNVADAPLTMNRAVTRLSMLETDFVCIPSSFGSTMSVMPVSHSL